MNWSTGLQVAELIVITLGLLGGLVQLRHMRITREREAALALLQSFMAPEFARSFSTLMSLPENLSPSQVDELPPEIMSDIYLMGTTIESIGILVQRGELDLGMVDDFYSGPIILFWRKLAPYFREVRVRNDRATIGEWCEWLANQLGAQEQKSPPVPAYIAHKDWTPAGSKRARI